MRCDGLGRAIENVVVTVRGPRCTQVEGTVCGKPFTQVLVVTLLVATLLEANVGMRAEGRSCLTHSSK